MAGHVSYRGSAPIFVTTKRDDVERLERLASTDPVTGKPYDTNASMCHRRLKVYNYSVRIEKPEVKIPYCPACFAQLVLAQAGNAASATGI